MKEILISDITREMLPFLNNAQMLKLQEVLNHCFWNVTVEKNENQLQDHSQKTNEEYLDMFITAKRIEGCSVYSGVLPTLFRRYKAAPSELLNSLILEIQ